MSLFAPHPERLWKNGSFSLPAVLWRVYRDELRARNLLDAAEKGSAAHPIGGADTESSLEHFTHRFANSGSRIQAVLLDPERRFKAIPQWISTTFSSHQIAVLDAPCGTGGSIVALLCLLAELRDQRLLPQLPMEITVLGADFSDDARNVYDSVMLRLVPELASKGITLKSKSVSWDAERSDRTSQLCDLWFHDNPSANEYAVLVTNFSGHGKEIVDTISPSFQHILDRLSSRKSLLIWLEPGGKGAAGFLKKIWNKFRLWSAGTDSGELLTWTGFRWSHELISQELHGSVSVRQFSRDSQNG